jgi:S-adenosylmethionine uptake transporter
MPPLGLTTRSLGIVLYLTAVFFFAINDALGKWLVADYGVGQLLALRTVGAAFVLGPMVWRFGVALSDTRNIGLQILRILCMALDTFCFYYATRTMPLADVMTFYMASPLLITAMSALFLGEKVEAFRWAAVGAGFVGVIIALQPSAAIFSTSSPLALLGATMFALGQTATRRLRGAHWLHLVVWQFVGAGLIGAATLPWIWISPSPRDLALLFLLGIVAMLCFVCMTRALAMAPAATLAPFFYSSLIWATIVGWIVWRDAPTWPILLGNVIIVGSGLFVLHRDREPSVALVD